MLSVADEMVPALHSAMSAKPTTHPLTVLLFCSDLVGHSVDVGPCVIYGELDGFVCLSDHVQVALVILIPFTRHPNKRLTAADDHCLVLPVDP